MMWLDLMLSYLIQSHGHDLNRYLSNISIWPTVLVLKITFLPLRSEEKKREEICITGILKQEIKEIQYNENENQPNTCLLIWMYLLIICFNCRLWRGKNLEMSIFQIGIHKLKWKSTNLSKLTLSRYLQAKNYFETIPT